MRAASGRTLSRGRPSTVSAERRWGRAVVAVVALALVASLLVLAPRPTTAGAQDLPPPVTTVTEWSNDCVGVVGPIRQPQTEPLGFAVTAPQSVAPGDQATIRIHPEPGSLPDRTYNPVVGWVTVFGLSNVRMMYLLPTNSSFVSASIVPNSWSNIAGTPSVSLNTTDYPEPRIVLHVPEVVKNPVPPDNATPFQLPAIDVVVEATGPVGSNIVTRTAGTNETTSGYRFTALNSSADAAVYCWPAGEVQGPIMSQTAIGSGGQVQPTTTELSVDPLVIGAGGSVTMRAAVTAPSGVVQFLDGGTSLGLALLDGDGVATLTTPLANVGERVITARFLGSPGYEESQSEPVVVTVLDPAELTPVQVEIAPPTISFGNADLGQYPVSVSILPVSGSSVPTGTVTLFNSGTAVGTLPLSSGAATFAVDLVNGGNALRAEYSGDAQFRSGLGIRSVIGTNSTSTSSIFASRPVTGTMKLNGLTNVVPGGTTFAASFRTDENGVQSLDGTFQFPIATYPTPGGGSVTGQLTQVGGLSAGQISNVWDGTAWLPDADAELSAGFQFQVTAIDLNDGNGQRTLASTCAVGPFTVSVSGTRAGVNGGLVLDGGVTPVPFPPAGACVGSSGEPLAGQVGAILAGGQTDVELSLTPPPAAAPTVVSPVSVVPAGGASYGQPVTLTATVSRFDGVNLASGASGRMEFYVNDAYIGDVNVTGGASPTKSASIVIPNDGNPPLPPLPEGTSTLTARFNPATGQKLILAASPMSPPSSYTVFEPLPKRTPSLEVEVPESAALGEVVTVTVTMDPAPNAAGGAAELSGFIILEDEYQEDPLQRELPISSNWSTSSKRRNSITVSPGDDGIYTTEIALAPGVYGLKAVFVPSVASAWGWNGAASEPAPHTVIGSQLPTQLSIVADSTAGTGVAPTDSLQVIYTLQIDPAVVAQLGPNPVVPRLIYEGNPAAATPFDESGRAQFGVPLAFFDRAGAPGPNQLTFIFDPAMRGVDGIPYAPSNQLFLASSVTSVIDFVDPAGAAPIASATQVRAVSPTALLEGAPWTSVEAQVTSNAVGNVSFTARHLQTGTITQLGTVGLSSFSFGQAILSGPALESVTSAFAPGTYEVRASFTPSDPDAWQPSNSAPFVVEVYGDLQPTETVLEVTPAGLSRPGAPVVLEAHVTPTAVSQGTVEFFDGASLLGTSPVTGGGVASLVVFDLSEGIHSLTAEFVPADSDVAEASTSLAVSHLVADGVETTTTLSVTPEGESLEGDEVTLTAVLDPTDAVGSVTFEDESGVLGTVDVVDGEAVLVLDDLAAGVYEFQAIFEAADPGDFRDSISDVVSHLVIAQAVPEAPDGVSATGLGLMARVSWEPPEGSNPPITSYTVTASPGGAQVTVSSAVTVVDVLGLEAGEDYSFSVVASNAVGDSDPSTPSNVVTVTTAERSFSDVPPSHPFFAEILWMAEVGLSTGYEDETYGPSLTLSRQAMSAFLYRLSGSPNGIEPECSDAPFTDVPVDHPFCGEIAWMADSGISTGYPDGTYRPVNGLSREAMSAFLYRLAGSPDGEDPICTTPPFTDVPTTNAFCGEIAWMAAVGISEGYPDGRYRPSEILTRQAMSAFLYRYTLVVETPVI